MMQTDTKSRLPEPTDALPGRDTAMAVPTSHFVNGNPLQGPFASSLDVAVLGLGCFWGAERKFWEADGVFTTSVGYAGGITPNPNYQEVCTGLTGHTEVVQVVFDLCGDRQDQPIIQSASESCRDVPTRTLSYIAKGSSASGRCPSTTRYSS